MVQSCLRTIGERGIKAGFSGAVLWLRRRTVKRDQCDSD